MISDSLGQNFHPILGERKIVSLVPSSTETLCALGLEDSLIGITRYCVHPPNLLETKQTVGGTKQLNWKSLEGLAPNIVIGNKEENTPSIFDGLKKRNIPYFVAFPLCVDDAIADIHRLGALFDTARTAQSVCQDIQAQRNTLIHSKEPFTYVYLIWRKPWMVVNHNTFIHSMLSEIGGINSCRHLDERYPTLELDTLKSLNPDVIFLSSEPYAFNDSHMKELKNNGFEQPILYIDGESCSWHGVRMMDGLKYLKDLKDNQIRPHL